MVCAIDSIKFNAELSESLMLLFQHFWLWLLNERLQNITLEYHPGGLTFFQSMWKNWAPDLLMEEKVSHR
jgi:hypothetical protein